MRKILKIGVYLMAIMATGCFSIKYDFKGGASIDPKIETLSVQYFSNRATRVEPSLSQNFTDKLRAYMENNTNLRIVNTVGDVDFSGEITEYKIQPTSISSGDVAAKTRFTVTIRVKYSNSVNPDDNYDESFSRYRDFEATDNFSAVEAELTEEIITEIVEQIFNKAFVNW